MVALSAILISAVGVAMGSIREAIGQRILTLVGDADARVQPRGTGASLDLTLLSTVKQWPEVERASARLTGTLALRFGAPQWVKPDALGEASGGGTEATSASGGVFRRETKLFQTSARVVGLADASITGDAVERVALASGRLPTSDNEVVIDEGVVTLLSTSNSKGLLSNIGISLFARGSGGITKQDIGPAQAATQVEADALNAAAKPVIGDWVEFVRFGKPATKLTIVGVAKQPSLGDTPQAYMTMQALANATDQAGKVSRIDITLREGVDAEAFAESRGAVLPANAALQTTAKITSGIDRNAKANQLAFTVGTLMAFIAAGFIITTGMSVGIVERRRELAILRCIGATPWQLAMAQLFHGALVGLAGAAVGVPIGVFAAWFMLDHFQERLQAPPIILADRVVWSFVGAIFAGLVGATLPAIQAMRVSPLQALASRAQPAKRRTLVIITIAGVAGVLIHLANFTLIRDGTTVFFTYVALGLPALMLGYFLLGVPAMQLVAKLFANPLEKLLNLPTNIVRRSIAATPYRFGFTAGAMMAGLALLVAIWTQGGAAMRDWINRINFPDGVVVGLNMPAEAQEALRAVPNVTDTCAISMHPVETTAFGIKGMTRVKTYFFAFEPEPFFRMSTIEWVEGDEKTARAKLEAGGAVIVTREFKTARDLKVGDDFFCWDDSGQEHRFEIAGVVTSPGLEVANNYFDIGGQDFSEQRIHAVFGSRKDLREKFNSDSIGLLQYNIREGADGFAVSEAVRAALLPYGILNAASSQGMKQVINQFVQTTLVTASLVAVFAMLVACLGVANLIIAGIHARQFEFGVFRAVGGTRGQLARIVLAESLLIALAAIILGSLMGLQGAFGGMRLNALIWGIDLRVKPPVVPMLWGYMVVIVMCVGAATPAVIRLTRRSTRELLATIRG
ncbi:adhesion component ABC transporter permease [Phycisphaerae bacterium]|nr:adhesion component ABC transporter permease [Phycisphaerae bacterium]